jgi:hypothetical protein
LSQQNLVDKGLKIFNSFRRDCTYIISKVALARDLYMAYVLDLDTVACFLALQLIRFVHKNIVEPPVDRRSSMSLAQSALEKALVRVKLHLPIFRLTPNVDRRYLKILFTSVKCSVVGLCK